MGINQGSEQRAVENRRTEYEINDLSDRGKLMINL
jgi:hypothetical protein